MKLLVIKIVRIKDLQGNVVRFQDLESILKETESETKSQLNQQKENIEKIRKLRQKIGIFRGEGKDEFITFRGNLDYEAEGSDYGHIEVSRYWESDDEQDECDKDWEEFEKFWNDEEEFEYIPNYKFQSVLLPDALKQNLVQVAPESKSEINLARPFSLYPIQREAVVKWKENKFHGIYEMATGTGKTRTAIGSIKELEKEDEKFITVVVVPTDTLGTQWKEELERWQYKTVLTMKNTNWKTSIEDLITAYSGNRIKNACIVTSYTTFANYVFQDLLTKECGTDIKKFLIADEVHHIGAPDALNGLPPLASIDYDFNLGLTATLKRYFDDVGTDFIKNYFHGVVYTYTMAQAIKDGILCKYKYHMLEVDLTKEEHVEYQAESITMAQWYTKSKKDPVADAQYQRAAERRADIVKSAHRKLEKLNEIMNEQDKFNFGIIFCNHGQIDQVQTILNNHKPRPIFSRKITHRATPNRKEKEEILHGLLKQDYDVILGINMLDEGWDCPEVKNCILMASSGNEKQYIQRRGRVLRPFTDGKLPILYPDGSTKEFAEIYDLCVMPDIPPNSAEEVRDMELGLAKKELVRMETMAETAMNYDECEKFISDIKARFGL